MFHIPLPKSVDDLKIAGFAALSGKAWLRVHVNDVDALLTELKRSSSGLNGSEKDDTGRSELPSPNSEEYMRAVGWEDEKQVKRPEYYSFPQRFGGTGWRGVIVVDRQRKLMFVEAQLF